MKQAVGVVGGVGPMATVYFMQRVIEMTKADCDQEHINMLVFNDCNIPDRTAFITKQSPDNPLPIMIEDAKRLEAAGCEFVVIPCNTAHYFYDELQHSVNIPVVNIVAETIRYAKTMVEDLKCVGILATTGTIVTGTYQKYAEEAGLISVTLDPKDQEKLMSIIYDGVKAGKPVAKADFDEVANALRSGPYYALSLVFGLSFVPFNYNLLITMVIISTSLIIKDVFFRKELMTFEQFYRKD